MKAPISPRTILPTTGRRHFGDDSIARREELELLRYQQQLEASVTNSRTGTPRGDASDVVGSPYSSKVGPSIKSSIPNSILAHYTDETTAEQRAEQQRHALALASKENEAARALQSKLIEDKIRAEQLLQIEIQKQIKEEEAQKSRALDAMMNTNAAAALRLAQEKAMTNKQKARDEGSFGIMTTMTEKQMKEVHERERKELERLEELSLAEQHKQEEQSKKDLKRAAAIADQRLWDSQRALQAVKNSPTKLLSPRENLRRHVESDQRPIEEQIEYQRLRDERALEEQRQQEEKVFKQLALISASTEGTVKMLTPRHHQRLETINTIGASVGMVERLDEGDKARLARSDVMKRNDAEHQEMIIKTRISPLKKPIQNGFHSWTSSAANLASSHRAEDEALKFESGPTMFDKLASGADADVMRRKQDGKHIEHIQKLQADQRRMEQDAHKILAREQRTREDMERKSHEDALKRHLDSMLKSHGVTAGSPKAHRLKPIDSPRRNPGPGAFGNYESRSSPLRRQ